MSEYKRLTSYMQVGDKIVAIQPQRKERIQEYINRLFELEDKIENGTLVELPFVVIDKKTKKEADCYKIARKEDWAKRLCYCDMEGFAITQDGMLILLDECGKYTYCPENRFKVVAESELEELQ